LVSVVGELPKRFEADGSPVVYIGNLGVADMLFVCLTLSWCAGKWLGHQRRVRNNRSRGEKFSSLQLEKEQQLQELVDQGAD